MTLLTGHTQSSIYLRGERHYALPTYRLRTQSKPYRDAQRASQCVVLRGPEALATLTDTIYGAK